jgi:hypothetical protein
VKKNLFTFNGFSFQAGLFINREPNFVLKRHLPKAQIKSSEENFNAQDRVDHCLRFETSRKTSAITTQSDAESVGASDRRQPSAGRKQIACKQFEGAAG